MGELRILLVEDHEIFRDALAQLLDSEPDLTVVGQVSSGEEAVRRVAELRPEVVIMDLDLSKGGGEMPGAQATREILTLVPAAAVLVLTGSEDDDDLRAAMGAGARGYLLKHARRPQVLSAIRAVAEDEAVFGPGLAGRVMSLATSPPPAAQPFPELTEREREVLAHIAKGHQNAAIARMLYISPKTVRNHVTNIFGKLHVANRSEAIVKARDAGL